MDEIPTRPCVLLVLKYLLELFIILAKSGFFLETSAKVGSAVRREYGAPRSKLDWEVNRI